MRPCGVITPRSRSIPVDRCPASSPASASDAVQVSSTWQITTSWSPPSGVGTTSPNRDSRTYRGHPGRTRGSREGPSPSPRGRLRSSMPWSRDRASSLEPSRPEVPPSNLVSGTWSVDRSCSTQVFSRRKLSRLMVSRNKPNAYRRRGRIATGVAYVSRLRLVEVGGAALSSPPPSPPSSLSVAIDHTGTSRSGGTSVTSISEDFPAGLLLLLLLPLASLFVLALLLLLLLLLFLLLFPFFFLTPPGFRTIFPSAPMTLPPLILSGPHFFSSLLLLLLLLLDLPPPVWLLLRFDSQKAASDSSSWTILL
mmetsp:Transcript_21312/g.50711  ORF Transcript_21312/g.50711 Transcript_21312/m.50711 type:complete len:309 (+) Transcript_21312:349-1275(+)